MAKAPAELPDTFPRLLLHHAHWRDKHPALREKDLGIWQTWTWAQVADEVKKLAAGLHVQGFLEGLGRHGAIVAQMTALEAADRLP
jgi:long-chain acyl-CoA synthetase